REQRKPRTCRGFRSMNEELSSFLDAPFCRQLQCRTWAGQRLDRQVRRPPRPQNRPNRLGRANSVFQDAQLRTTCARKPSDLPRALRGWVETPDRSGSTTGSEVQLRGLQWPRAGVLPKTATPCPPVVPCGARIVDRKRGTPEIRVCSYQHGAGRAWLLT